jgi:hypothetical protein
MNNSLIYLIIATLFSKNFESIYNKFKYNNNQESNQITLLQKKIKDLEVINNPLVAPEKRANNIYISELRSIPTRGPIDDFQVLGLLSNLISDKKFQLYGRRTYRTSTIYEYYLLGNDGNNFNFKYPLSDREEIRNGELITLSDLDTNPFKAIIYENREYRYTPYI